MSKILRCAIYVFLVLVSLQSQAQSSVKEDPQITRMLKAYEARNKGQSTVKAWRIQLSALSERRAMENEKVRFERLFPYLRLEWVYDNPYYILKVRDVAYKHKIDALHLLHRIKTRYPSAILLLDDVKPEKLLNSRKF